MKSLFKSACLVFIVLVGGFSLVGCNSECGRDEICLNLF